MKQYFEQRPWSGNRKEYKEKYNIEAVRTVVEEGIGLPKNYNVELYRIKNDKVCEKVYEINVKSSSANYASCKAFDLYVEDVIKQSQK